LSRRLRRNPACGRNDTTIRRHDATGAFGAFTTSTKLTKDTKKSFVSLFDGLRPLAATALARLQE